MDGENCNNRFSEFLKGRRGKGGSHTIRILKALKNHPKGLRAGELKRLEICHNSTLFRLLDDLCECNFIKKNKWGSHYPSTYFISSGLPPNIYFETEDDVRAEHDRLALENFELRMDLIAAQWVLDRHPGLWDEYLKEKASITDGQGENIVGKEREN